MTARIIPVIALITAGLLTTIATASKPTHRPSAVTLQLQKIKEVRLHEIVKDDSGFSFDTPGLELEFAIKTPDGRQIVEIREPDRVVATDSDGTDLSRLPDSGFGMNRHVETVSEWEKPPHALKFKLALPKRSATSFSLDSTMNAVTFTDTEEATIPVTSKETDVRQSIFGEPVTVSLNTADSQVVFTPGTVKDMVESIELVVDGKTLDYQGAMWNDAQVSFMFTGKITKPNAKVNMTVRKGLEVMPIRVALIDQQLP